MGGPAVEPLGAGRIAPCPGPGRRALLPFYPAQAQAEFQGAGPCHTRGLEGHRGIQGLLTYPWVLEVAKVVGGFSWTCSVVSDFHPFICFTAGTGDWSPSGVPTHPQQLNAPLSRGIFFVPKAFNRVR